MQLERKPRRPPSVFRHPKASFLWPPSYGPPLQSRDLRPGFRLH